MLSGADAGIKMNSTILNSIHIIERNDKMANRAFGWNLKNHRKQMKENKKRLAYRKFIIRASEGRKAAIKVGLANG